MPRDVHTEGLTDEQLEALLEVVFMVSLPDGELGQLELAELRDRLAELEDRRLTADGPDGLMLRAAMNLEKERRDVRLAYARHVLGDHEARREALVLAIRVAGADGLDERERQAARDVADAFGVSPDDLEALLAA